VLFKTRNERYKASIRRLQGNRPKKPAKKPPKPKPFGVTPARVLREVRKAKASKQMWRQQRDGRGYTVDLFPTKARRLGDWDRWTLITLRRTIDIINVAHGKVMFIPEQCKMRVAFPTETVRNTVRLWVSRCRRMWQAG